MALPGARYYDSDIGRWTSVDPLADKRQGLSPYIYVQNNPLNKFDPNGMIDWWKVVGGAASIIGGAFQVSFGMSLAVGTSVTGVGIVGGLALASYGTTTIAFGTANLIEGFKDEPKKIATGLFDAIGGETLGKQGATVRKVVDEAIGLIGTSPLKSVKNINELLPSNAKEAKNFDMIRKATVVKETMGLGIQVKTTNDLIKNTMKILYDPDDDEEENESAYNNEDVGYIK